MTNSSHDKYISITHINIRQSISFLIIKLIIIEAIAVITTLFFYLSLPQIASILDAFQISRGLLVLIFIFLAAIKMYLSFLVIFMWLNEYYEVSPLKIIYRSGFIFRHEEQFTLSHVSSITLRQTLIGKFLNYGTIELYDRFDKKRKYLYLIHNPIRYFQIVESLLPSRDEAQHKIREHLIEEDERL